MRASDTSEVVFQDCRVSCGAPARRRRAGVHQHAAGARRGRIGIAALSVGLAQGAYEAALRYAKERRQFGQPIAAFQAIQWKLADNATRIEAARLLTYRAAYLKDRGVADDARVVDGQAVSRARSRSRPRTTASRFTAATAS